jgi:hypothetical protein
MTHGIEWWAFSGIWSLNSISCYVCFLYLRLVYLAVSTTTVSAAIFFIESKSDLFFPLNKILHYSSTLMCVYLYTYLSSGCTITVNKEPLTYTGYSFRTGLYLPLLINLHRTANCCRRIYCLFIIRKKLNIVLIIQTIQSTALPEFLNITSLSHITLNFIAYM